MSIHPENIVHYEAGVPKQSYSDIKTGILALQGDYLEHANMLCHLGASVCEVRTAEQLKNLDALIIPGGESTTIGKLIDQFHLNDPIKQFVKQGNPTWGTCAGMILLAKNIGPTHSGAHVVPQRLAVMDITVSRNAFGRQVDSFETDLIVPALDISPGAQGNNSSKPFRAVFIRAPFIESASDEVTVLARLKEPPVIVAVRQGNILGTAFHPELTDDSRFHRYFLEMCVERNVTKTKSGNA